MKLYLSLSTDAARERFVRTGEDLPGVLCREVPTAEILPDSRALLASFASLGGTFGTALTLPPKTIYDREVPASLNEPWRAPFLPETPAEWETLIAAYTTALTTWRANDRAKRQARLDAALPILRAGEYVHFDNDWTDLDGYQEARALDLARTRAAEERKREEEARNKALREAEAARQAARQATAEADKIAWITAHGSDFLRRASTAGYDCQRRYVTERAETEYPGYVVDFADNALWRSRSCPSEAGLTEAERIGGEVVWLTASTNPDIDIKPCEAVIIERFLNRYTLIRII